MEQGEGKNADDSMLVTDKPVGQAADNGLHTMMRGQPSTMMHGQPSTMHTSPEANSPGSRRKTVYGIGGMPPPGLQEDVLVCLRGLDAPRLK